MRANLGAALQMGSSIPVPPFISTKTPKHVLTVSLPERL